MEQGCPRCKTTKYRNPTMRLMVNVCGHNLCESCVELLFVKGSGACPECDIPLRRGNYRLQLFEDANVDKEVDIRRRILKDFNKQEEDFDSLKEFNDYLEMVEDIIFNLSNNLDVLETNKRILHYKEVNKEQIIRNRSRPSKDAIEIEDLIALESKQNNQRKLEMKVLEEAEKAAKIKNKEKLIDDLMFGEQDANRILEEHREQVARQAKTTFSTGTDTSASVAVTSTVRTEDVPYVYEEPTLELMGPPPPTEAEMDDLVVHVRRASSQERAGGYVESIGCLRAVQEAMAGLYFVPGAK